MITDYRICEKLKTGFVPVGCPEIPGRAREWAGTGASTVESSKKTDNIANNAKGRNLFRLLTVIAL